MALAGTVFLALCVFVLPGFVVSWVAGAKVPAALVASLPVSFSIFGLSAWMWGATSAPFTWLTFVISLLLALVAAAMWRVAFARRARRKARRAGEEVSWREALWPGPWRSTSVFDPSWILPAAGVVTGAWLSAADKLSWLVRLPHGVGNIHQGWDAQWHANVVRFIMTENIASPARMGELQNLESKATLLYPSGYHTGIALFAEAAGLEPIPALNIANALLPSVAVAMSMACLVLAMLRSRGLTAQIAAGLAAIAVYAVPPLWIADYVAMWPYLFAACMAGTVVYLFCEVPSRRAMAFPAALAFVGLLEVHPSAVTYVALPVVLFWLTSLLIRPARSRLGDFVWLGLPAVAGALLFLPQALAGSAQADEVSGWTTPEDLGLPDPLKAVLMLGTRHVPEFFPSFNPVAVVWLAAAGLIIALVWRGQIWPVLFYAVSVAAAVNALQPMGGWWGSALTAIGALHYNTAHRLVLPVGMITIAGASIAVAAMIRLLCLGPLAARRGSTAWLRASVIASSVVALAAGAATAWWAEARTATGAEASYSASRVNDRMINDNDRLAFDWLATQPAAWEGYTMGDPGDGHSWLYAYNGVPTLSRHYMWPVGGRGSNTDIIYWQSDMLGNGVRGDTGDEMTENIVDKAAKDLNVRFFILSPEVFWREQFPNYEQRMGLWTAPGSTPVFKKGGTVIFAVNEHFTGSELRKMRADGLDHGSEPLPELAPVGARTAAGP